MPSNLLTADTAFPTLTAEQSTDEKLEMITSYLYMLLEQLRYSMGNLDKDNFNDAGLEEIANIITQPVYVQLKDDEQNIMALQETAQGMDARISDAEGNITALSATSTSMSSRITNAEGSISAMQQTATSMQSRISDAEGNISAMQQTVNGMTLSVENGSSSSTIKLMANGTQLSSQVISVTGMVTLSALAAEGQTTINGSNITTGEITAINIKSCNIFGCNIYATYGDYSNYTTMTASGMQVYLYGAQKAFLGINPNRADISPALVLGALDAAPAYVCKYYDGGNMMWIGNGTTTCGILINFDAGTIKTVKYIDGVLTYTDI